MVQPITYSLAMMMISALLSPSTSAIEIISIQVWLEAGIVAMVAPVVPLKMWRRVWSWKATSAAMGDPHMGYHHGRNVAPTGGWH